MPRTSAKIARSFGCSVGTTEEKEYHGLCIGEGELAATHFVVHKHAYNGEELCEK